MAQGQEEWTMKSSTVIAVVLAAVLAFVAMAVVAVMLWGWTGWAGGRAITLCYLPIGAALFLCAHKHRTRWEVIALALGYLVLAGAFAISWLSRGRAAAEEASTVLTYIGAACIWAGAIGYWRRCRGEKRTQSDHPDTTQAA